jgi:hypothetical protein
MRCRVLLWATTAAALGLAAPLIGVSTQVLAQLPGGPPRPDGAPVTYEAPVVNATEKTSNVTITAFVLLGDVREPGQEINLGVECVGAGCEGVTITRTLLTKDEPCQRVEFAVPIPRNGRYKATISGPGRAGLLKTGRCEAIGQPPREFFVAAPPVRPAGVRAVPGPGKDTANISWNRNPEPDMLGYVVQRARGSGPFEQIGETAEPSFRDGAAGGAGNRYRVIAVRRGPHGPIPSEPSAAVGIGAPGGVVSRGGRGAPAKPVDLSKFTRLVGQAERAAQGPDGSFDPNLPYGEETEPGEQDEELGADERRDDRRRTVGFVAGGLLTLAVMLHLWWVKREAEREPLEALPPPRLPEIREPLPG